MIDFALQGDHRNLQVLRQQATAVWGTDRTFTGVGFYARLHVDPSKPPLEARRELTIADVEGQVPSLERGVGFVIFVHEGYLAGIEGFTFDEPWPADLGAVTLAYSSSGAGVDVLPRPPGSTPR